MIKNDFIAELLDLLIENDFIAELLELWIKNDFIAVKKKKSRKIRHGADMICFPFFIYVIYVSLITKPTLTMTEFS